MGDPTADLRTEQAILAAAIGVVEELWKKQFAQYKKDYEAALNTVTKRLDDAGKLQTKTILSMLGKIADIAAKPFGVYGMIASVAMAGLNEYLKGSVRTNEAIKLNAPSANTFGADLEATAANMFEPLKRKSYEIARVAAKTPKVDEAEMKTARSRLLASPIWYPPQTLSDTTVARQIETVLWCGYFTSLYRGGYASHELRFLEDIVAYLIDNNIVTAGESAGWRDYPTPVSRGGPGDFLEFLRKTNYVWNWKLNDYLDKGWLTPLPVIPDNHKIQKSVLWTPPKPATFKAPTKSGRATITVVDVEMTLMPSIDWNDVPALKKK